MGYTYKYANVEAGAGGMSGITGRAYALVDTSATVCAVSEEVARSANLRGNRMTQMRGFRRDVLGAWVAEATVEILGTKLPIRTPVLIVPRGVLEEDAIIGRDYVAQMVPKIDIRVFPTPSGMTCDSCDNVITMCRCAMKPIASAAPPQQGQGGQPPTGGPPAGVFNPPPLQNLMGPGSPGPWGPNPTR
jgi:predicted aspartyl protease